MDRKELQRKFYVTKDYDNLKLLLEDSKSIYEKEYLAKIYVEEKNFTKASKIYRDIGLNYEYGRCELLNGDIEKARKIWGNVKEDSSPLLWGKSLLEFINLYVVHVPTFFQIRAFLEVDLDALLKAGHIAYCENIVNGAHLFAQNNQESYKFIGRVFVNNSYFDLAELFLKRAKDICYVDPEVHFLLAKCHIHNNNIKEAKKALNTSIEKGYGYYPAKKLLETINLS